MKKTSTTRTTRTRSTGGRKRLPAEVTRAVRAAFDKKATDVVVLDLRDTPAFTDFFVLCSGQIPLDPAAGTIVEGDFAAQARRVLDNLSAVLAAAGCSMADVVRTTIYLTDLADFAGLNEIYAGYFEAPFPARSTVQVAALPRGARVEIDAMAYTPRGGSLKQLS